MIGAVRELRASAVILALTSAIGCIGRPVVGGEPPDAAKAYPARWPCPSGWVHERFGACGPAALLCVPDGGAAPGACARVDLTRPPPIELPEGGAIGGLRRLPDGGVGGAWPESDRVALTADSPRCAEGWRELPDGTCDPVLRADCPAGGAALPDGTCTATAEVDCPGGVYPDVSGEVGGARVLHVRAGASAAGANGSVARPFPTIGGAMTIALQGNWVLVAAGDYYEPGTVLVRNVHLVGVCAARVVWHESSFTPLTVRGVTFHLRSFTVRGGFQGLTARDGANLEIERVRVEDMSGCGVLARGEGSVVRIRDSVIRGARPDAMNRNGYGLLADSGGVVFAERTAILDTQRVGVFAAADGSIDLAQSIVRGTRSVGLNAGFGVSNGLGGRVHGAGVVIDDNQKTGVVALGSGDGIRLEASVVRDTRALEGAYGAGLSAQEGGSLRIERVRVERNTGNGVLTSGEGSRAEVLSSVVMGTRAGSGGSESFGVNSRAGASSSVVGSIISGSSGSGVLVSGRARLELSATRVLDSRVAGLTAQLGAELHASGVLVDGAEQFGLRVVGEGTRAEVTASAFRNIMAPGSPVPATGVAAASDAVLDARGVVVERVRGFGVVSYLSATLSIADALVLDISSTGSSSGYGLAAFAGSINAARTAVVRATTASVSCGSGRKAGGVEYPGRFDGRDLFLRDVHSNVLTGYEGEPTRDAAFGFYLPNGVGSLDRAAIIGGRAGFYSGGSLTFSNGVVARQSETFGVTNPRLPASANRFSDVASIDNQVGEVVRDAFPSSAAFEAPTPICASDVCQ